MADRFLADGLEVLRVNDGTGDVPTTVDLRRDGGVGTFNVGDGIVNTFAEKNEIFALPGHVQVVTDLQVCGNTFKPSIIGCSGSNLSLIVELMNAGQQLDGILWMHEYGHNRGLDHRDVAFAVMNGTIAPNHRRVNQFEHDRYVVPFPTRVSETNVKEQPGKLQQVDVRQFVRRLYPEGIPYAQATAPSPGAVPVLLGLLADRNEELYWTNIVTTLGMIGRPEAIEPLIRFLESGAAQPVSLLEFRAKLAVQPALGYILAKQSHDRTFTYLREGLNPEAWARRISWRAPAAGGNVNLNAQLTEMAIWGLALSGRADAGSVLTQLRATITAERAKFGVDAEQVISDALRAHATIARVGLVGYYAQE